MIFDGIVLLSDIDGTLATYDRTIPQVNLDALKYFTQNGGRFGIATGRTARSAQKMMENLPVNCPCIVVNGGGIYDPATDEMLFSCYLDHRALDLVFQIVASVQSVGVEINVDGILHCIKYSPRSEEHVRYELGSFTQYTLDDIPSDSNWYKALITGTPEEINQVEHLCGRIIPDGAPFYVIRSEPTLFEILPKEATKGEGVRRVSEYLGVPIQNIYAIGDFYNDIDLLKAAGYSAAVGGAPQEVIAVTDYITCSCEGGAVADFITYIEQKIKTSQ